MLNGSFGATIKLLPCDLVVTDLNRRNNFLQSLHTMDQVWYDASPIPRIDGSFIYRVTLFMLHDIETE